MVENYIYTEVHNFLSILWSMEDIMRESYEVMNIDCSY